MLLLSNSFLREPVFSVVAAGGAVFAAAAAALSGCTFANNSANAAGALAVLLAASTIDNCTFTGNVCTFQGGAVFIVAPADTVTISNSVFTDSSAVQVRIYIHTTRSLV
jgi:predicted outer membrane repeat protein